jgi:hypothetical protein
MNRSELVAKSYEKKELHTVYWAICSMYQSGCYSYEKMYVHNEPIRISCQKLWKKELHTVYWAICSMYQLLEIFHIVDKSSEHCHKMVNSSKISKSN